MYICIYIYVYIYKEMIFIIEQHTAAAAAAAASWLIKPAASRPGWWRRCCYRCCGCCCMFYVILYIYIYTYAILFDVIEEKVQKQSLEAVSIYTEFNIESHRSTRNIISQCETHPKHPMAFSVFQLFSKIHLIQKLDAHLNQRFPLISMARLWRAQSSSYIYIYIYIYTLPTNATRRYSISARAYQ